MVEGLNMADFRMLLSLSLVVCLGGCASTPTAFRADSAANPAAPEAPRYPVANILAASDPLTARVCPESGPCVMTSPNVKAPEPAESEHHHHHHH